MMKTLYLVRHAKSSWEQPGLRDIERPLLEKGIVKTRKVIRFLQERKITIDLMISSPAVRALETARLFADGLNYPEDKIIFASEIYEGNTDEILSVISATANDVGTLMLFGHNPNITLLASLLLQSDIDYLPTSGITCISFPAEKWKKISSVKGKEEFHVYPRML